jgi:hypothetical protein
MPGQVMQWPTIGDTVPRGDPLGINAERELDDVFSATSTSSSWPSRPCLRHVYIPAQTDDAANGRRGTPAQTTDGMDKPRPDDQWQGRPSTPAAARQPPRRPKLLFTVHIVVAVGTLATDATVIRAA